MVIQYSAIIVDDEQKSRAALKADLQDYCKNIAVVGEADGVESAKSLIEEVNPDVVFLDVKMNDGTGFDLLSQIPKPQFNVIFTTAYDRYAIKAFKFSAIDYLLKPIDRSELIDAVGRLKKSDDYQSILNSFKTLLDNSKSAISDKIVLSSSGEMSVYKISQVLRIEADSNYSNVHFLDEPSITVSKTLKDFEELLSNHAFERVHQSHLINIDQIKKLSNKEGTYILMSDGSVIPVAQRKRSHIRQLIESL